MKTVFFTLATLLTASTISMASDGDVNVITSEKTPPGPEVMPAKMTHHKHKKMSKDDMKKMCEGHLAKAKEAAAKITWPQAKTMADLIVGNMEKCVAAYDSYKDEDREYLSMLDRMCHWCLNQVEKLAKKDERHKEAEKREAERTAKKAEREAKKAEREARSAEKKEEKAASHDKMKVEEPKKESEHKPEEKKTDAPATQSSPVKTEEKK